MASLHSISPQPSLDADGSVITDVTASPSTSPGQKKISSGGNETSATKVFVRVRPFSPSELSQGGTSSNPRCIAAVDPQNPSYITTLDPSKNFQPKSTYVFDRCFNSAERQSSGQTAGSKGNGATAGPLVTIDDAKGIASDLAAMQGYAEDQTAVYDAVGRPVLFNALDGYNGCVFAYGQTGSGKTYTMMGPPGTLGATVTTGVAAVCAGGPGSPSSTITPRKFKRANTSLAMGGAAAETDPANSKFQSFASMRRLATPRAAKTPRNGGRGTASPPPEEAETPTSPETSCLLGDGSLASARSAQAGDVVTHLVCLEGIVPRLVREMFSELQRKRLKDSSHSFRVEVEYYEIYREKVMDLLGSHSAATNTEMRVRQSKTKGPYVENLTRRHVEDEKAVFRTLRVGNQRRHTASTAMNDRSSRSHAIFVLHLVQMSIAADDTSAKVTSKVNLVDLAGSERTGAHNAEGDQFREGVVINNSLTVLGRVIDALADKSQGKRAVFAPYRDSVLTWLLMDSLGGNSKTTMVATVSPHHSNFDEACQTLRYASRAKQIITRVVVNEDPQVRQIKMLTAEVQRLKALLTADGKFTENDEDIEALQDRVQQLEEELADTKTELDRTTSELAILRSSRVSALPTTLKTSNAGAAGNAKELARAKNELHTLEAERLLHGKTEEDLRQTRERLRLLEVKAAELQAGSKTSLDTIKKLEKELAQRDKLLLDFQPQPAASPKSGASGKGAGGGSKAGVLKDVQAQLAEERRKSVQLSEELDLLKQGQSQEKNSASQQLAERSSALRKAELEVKRLRTELKSTRDEVEASSKHLRDSFADESRRVQEETAMLKRNLKEEKKAQKVLEAALAAKEQEMNEKVAELKLRIKKMKNGEDMMPAETQTVVESNGMYCALTHLQESLMEEEATQRSTLEAIAVDGAAALVCSHASSYVQLEVLSSKYSTECEIRLEIEKSAKRDAASLEEHLTATRAAHDATLEEKALVESDIRQLTDILNALRAEKEHDSQASKDQVVDLETRLSESMRLLRKEQSSVEALQRSVEGLESQLKEKQLLFEKSEESRKAHVARSVEQAEEGAETMKQLRDQMASDQHRHEAVVADLTAQRDTLHNSMAAMEAAAAASSNEVAGATAERDALQTRVDDLEAALAKSKDLVKQQIARGVEQLQEHQQALSVVQARMAEKDAAHVEQVRALETASKEATDKAQSLCDDAAALATKCAKLESSLAEAEAASVRAASERQEQESALRDVRAALQHEKESSCSAADAQGAEVVQLRSTVQRMREELSAKEEAMQDLHLSLGGATSSVEVLTEKLHKSEESRKELVQRGIERGNAHSEEVRQLEATLEASRVSGEARAEDLQKEKAQLEAQLRDTEHKLETTTKEARCNIEAFQNEASVRASALEKELFSAKECLATSEQTIERQAKERCDLETRCDSLREELEATRTAAMEQSAAHGAEMTGKTQEIAHLEERLVESTNALAEQGDSLDALRKELEAAKKIGGESAASVERLTAAKAALETELLQAKEQHEKRVKDLDRDIEASRSSCAAAEEKAQKLEAANLKATEDRTHLQRTLEEERKASAQKSREGEEAMASMKETFSSQLREKTAQAEGAQREHDRLAEKLASLEAARARDEASIVAKEEQMRQSAAQISQLVDTQQFMRRQIEGLKEELMESKETAKTNMESLVCCEEALKDVTDRLAAAAEEKATLVASQQVMEANLETAHGHQRALLEKVGALESQCQSLQAETVTLNDRAETQETLLAERAAHVAELEAAIQQTAAEQAALKQQQDVDFVHQQLDTMTEFEEQFRSMEAQKEQLISEHKAAVDAMQQTIEKQTTQIKHLREDLEFRASLDLCEADVAGAGHADPASGGAGSAFQRSNSGVSIVGGMGAGGSTAAPAGTAPGNGGSRFGGVFSSFFRRSSTSVGAGGAAKGPSAGFSRTASGVAGMRPMQRTPSGIAMGGTPVKPRRDDDHKSFYAPLENRAPNFSFEK